MRLGIQRALTAGICTSQTPDLQGSGGRSPRTAPGCNALQQAGHACAVPLQGACSGSGTRRGTAVIMWIMGAMPPLADLQYPAPELRIEGENLRPQAARPLVRGGCAAVGQQAGRCREVGAPQQTRRQHSTCHNAQATLIGGATSPALRKRGYWRQAGRGEHTRAMTKSVSHPRARG